MLYHQYGVWEAANFEKLTFSEILEENHCTNDKNMQNKLHILNKNVQMYSKYCDLLGYAKSC